MQNQSGEKSQEPYDFTCVYDIKQKTESNKQINPQTQITVWWLPEGKGEGESKGSQIYGD